jgi:hypothetical protein
LEQSQNGGEFKLYKSSGAAPTLIAEPNGQFLGVGGNDGKSAINSNGDLYSWALALTAICGQVCFQVTGIQ